MTGTKLSRLAETLGLSKETLRYRIRQGWTGDKLTRQPCPPIKPGTRFGNWTAIGPGNYRVRPNQSKVATVLCRCDCGYQREVDKDSLLTGKSRSCGCKKRANKLAAVA